MFAPKKKSLISGKTFALFVIILFAAGYFINTYDFGGSKENSPASEDSEQNADAEPNLEANASVTSEKDKITAETQLLMRIVDNVTGTTKTQQLVMPDEAIGKTFTEAKTYLLSKYEGCLVKEMNESYALLYKVIEKSTQEAYANTGEEPDETEKQEQTKSEYYLLKEENGVIKVYFSDKNGKLTHVQNTEISTDLLSVADQELFRYGIIKHSMDEVNEILQDFEG